MIKAERGSSALAMILRTLRKRVHLPCPRHAQRVIERAKTHRYVTHVALVGQVKVVTSLDTEGFVTRARVRAINFVKTTRRYGLLHTP